MKAQLLRGSQRGRSRAERGLVHQRRIPLVAFEGVRGKCSDSQRMMRSCTTLASTEAAATEAQSRVGVHDGSDQAETALVARARRSGRDVPGRRDNRGRRAGVGRRPGLGHPRLVAFGRAGVTDRPGVAPRRRRRSSSRRASLSCLESRASRHGAQLDPRRTTATPTVKGPAHAPRPTSSTPATPSKPSLRSRRSSPRPEQSRDRVRRLNTMGP